MMNPDKRSDEALDQDDGAPRVSVVMAAFNYGEFIDAAIRSVLQQDFDAWELIVVDDHSSDETATILEQHRDDPRIRVTRNSRNLGLTASCNVALAQARGEYVVRLDADDLLDENALAVLSRTLDRNPDVDLVYTDHLVIDARGAIVEYMRRSRLGEEALVPDFPPISTGTMIRRRCMEELGGYDETLRCQDTYDLWLRFLRRHRAKSLHLPLWSYRRHGRGLTDDRKQILRTRQRVKEKFVEQDGEPLPESLGLIPARRHDPMGDYLCLRKLGGLSLLERKIREAIASGVFRHVVVTTDDESIASAARDSGATVVLRPPDLCGVGVPIEPVALHALEQVRAELNFAPEVVAVLMVNSPFLDRNHAREGIHTLGIFGVDSVISVCPDRHLHYRRGRQGLERLFPRRKVRLEREVLFEENGALYISRTSCITQDSFLGESIGHIEMSEDDSLSIDSETDWRLAETLADRPIEVSDAAPRTPIQAPEVMRERD